MPTINPSRRALPPRFCPSRRSSFPAPRARRGTNPHWNSAPFTGTGSPYGKEIEEAARAAAVVNDAGGVVGRKLELVVADDESVPTSGVAAARKLIDVDKVVSISVCGAAPWCWP